MSKEPVVPAEDNDDKSEMVVKTALGQAHPAQCWGWHDGKAKECTQCLVAEKCEDFTRRLSGKGTPVVQPSSGIVKPKSLAVAAEKQDAESKPEPKSEPKPVVKEAKPESKAEPKPAVKEEAKPVVKEEAKPEPKVEPKPVVKEEAKPLKNQTETQEEKDVIVEAIMPRIPDGTFIKKVTESGFVYSFFDDKKKPILQVAVKTEMGKMKLLSPKNTNGKILDLKFSDAGMKEALDAVL